jgi:hypothetical protein
VKALKKCREGSCDVQLPTASIQAVRDTVNFSRPDAAEQVNVLARQMIVTLLRKYRQGGLRGLGEYRDKQHPARVSDELEMMMTRASVLPDVLPELRRYLLEYPNAPLANADSFFFWEKVDFGLKPTIRVNHAVIVRGRTTRGHEYGAVAIKQLYATHYFHTTLDVSVCVDDGGSGRTRGFYLLTIKGSQQEGLTGLKGSILRKVVVDNTRKSLERALASIKRTVETVVTSQLTADSDGDVGKYRLEAAAGVACELHGSVVSTRIVEEFRALRPDVTLMDCKCR